MPGNRWIEHVRAYSKANGISYGCAVSEAKASYVKAPKAPRKPRTPKQPKEPKVRAPRKPRTPKPKAQKRMVNREKEIEDFIKEIMAM
jgi:hypothetical protein